MKKKQAIEILKQHNHWRRGGDFEPTDPTTLGEALDAVLYAPSFETLEESVIQWANDRDLIKPDNAHKQALKMFSEAGELADAIIKDDTVGIIDGIGDTLVTIIILAHQLGRNPVQCLQSAYAEIKDRKGKTVGGTFIKE